MIPRFFIILVLFSFMSISYGAQKNAKDIIQLKRADHFGLTVPDLEQASLFFQETFGATVVDDVGPIYVPGGWMTENLNVPAKAVIKKIVLLEVPGQFFLELFNYEVDDQNTVLPNNSDHGGHHLGFEVKDIEVAAQQLRDKGIKVLGDTKVVKAGRFTIKWVYFVTPWGTSLELVEKSI